MQVSTGLQPQFFYSTLKSLKSAPNEYLWEQAKLPTAKRVLDLVAASLILLLSSPIWVSVTLLIYMQGGSPFFVHSRVGAGGKSFGCIKFRSMAVNSAQVLQVHLANDPSAKLEWQRTFKLLNDPRVTKLGAFIRKTSIDELPQLLNVLKGEMTLVGPRPVVKEEIQTYYRKHASKCFTQPPGITGLWQVTGRNAVGYSTRVALDLLYLQKTCFWFDLKIILLTGFTVVLRKGQ